MAAGVTVLRVDGLAVNRDGRPLVQEVSFDAARGDVLAIMGPSGAGKTTVMRAIAGLEPLSRGSVVIDGFTLTARGKPASRDLRELHRRVGIVFQFHHLFAHMTALQNVWLALVHVMHVEQRAAEGRARTLLEQLGVAHRAAALPRDLSGGEAQRVAIARALAVDPPLLLMDEPTASLDAGRRSELAALLKGLAAEGRTIIVATHDVDFVRACATRQLSMEAGRLVS